MREARIICPTHDNEGSDLSHVHSTLVRRLCESFGGCTETGSRGRWISNKGEFFNELVKVFDVAVGDDEGSLAKLRWIAHDLKHDARQETIYLRLPSGEVEFI